MAVGPTRLGGLLAPQRTAGVAFGRFPGLKRPPAESVGKSTWHPPLIWKTMENHHGQNMAQTSSQFNGVTLFMAICNEKHKTIKYLEDAKLTVCYG